MREVVWRRVATQRVANGGGLDVRAVRAVVRGALSADAGRVDLGDVDLLTAEIATNALRYSASGKPGGGVWVTVLRSAERVRVEVEDDGGSETVPEVQADCGESGRGLLMVREIADDWGYQVGSHLRRITTWFEMAS